MLGDYVPKRITTALGFNGHEAVFVFFVISGYLITTHSLARWGSLAQIDLLVERWAVPRGTARLLTTAGILGLLGVFVFGGEVSFALGELYMLLLTGSAALLIVGLHTQNADAEGSRAWAWLRSWGRLSYEVYLTHMFVVFALVAAFRAQGSDMRAGAWWYLPLLAGCWALGRGLAQAWSTPWDHALRRRYLSSPRPS